MIGRVWGRTRCTRTIAGCCAALVWVSSHGAEDSDIRRDATVRAIEIAMPSVVNIATETVIQVRDPVEQLFRDFFDPYYRRRPNALHSLGSGIIIDKRGYVLTNFHVVQRAGQIQVTLSDGREFRAEPVASTIERDLALLRLLDVGDQSFTPVHLAPDDDLILGETVLALGNPFGLGESVSRGILSSKARRPPVEDQPMQLQDWLQTDAAINPGNSGGPLINLRGELIGLNIAIYREGQGIGFAVPVKRISEALAEMFSPEAVEGLWFGARVVSKASGLEIAKVEEQSPAGAAGLAAGDRVIQVGGERPRSPLEFNQLLLAGDRRKGVPVLIERGDRKMSVLIQLVPETEFFNAGLVERRLGLTLQALTPELAGSLGLQNSEGLIIADVEEGGPSDQAGLRHGIVIRSIDGKPVDKISEVARIVHAKKPGARVALELIVRRRLGGGFIQLLSTTVEVAVRKEGQP